MSATREDGQEEMPKGNESKPLFEAARKVLLAGIGVVALAQDEIEDFVTRLVERGEIAEKDGRKLVQEMIAERRRGAEKAEEELKKRVEAALDRMNIPTKKDIDDLNKKVAALARKIDSLKKS